MELELMTLRKRVKELSINNAAINTDSSIVSNTVSNNRTVDNRIVNNNVISNNIIDNSVNNCVNGNVNNTINNVVVMPPFTGSGILSVSTEDMAQVCLASKEMHQFLLLSEYERTLITKDSPCAAFMADIVKRGHASPGSRNIVMDANRSDHVNIYQGNDTWVTRSLDDATTALAHQTNAIMKETASPKNLNHPILQPFIGGICSMNNQFGTNPEEITTQVKSKLIPHLRNLKNPNYDPLFEMIAVAPQPMVVRQVVPQPSPIVNAKQKTAYTMHDAANFLSKLTVSTLTQDSLMAAFDAEAVDPSRIMNKCWEADDESILTPNAQAVYKIVQLLYARTLLDN